MVVPCDVSRRHGDHEHVAMRATRGQTCADEGLPGPDHLSEVRAIGDIGDGPGARRAGAGAHLALRIDPRQAAREELPVPLRHAQEVPAHPARVLVDDDGRLGDRVERADLTAEDRVEDGRGHDRLRPRVLEIGPLGVLVLPPGQRAADSGEEQQGCERERWQPTAQGLRLDLRRPSPSCCLGCRTSASQSPVKKAHQEASAVSSFRRAAR